MYSFPCKKLAVLGALAFTVPLVPLFGAPAGGAMPAPSVLVEPAIEIDQTAKKSYVGHLLAIEEVDLRARVSGNITAIKFNEGDLVKPGQVLIELEDTTYRAKVQAAEAKCKQIEAELLYAKTNYERQKTLRTNNAVAVSAFDDAQRLYTFTQARLVEAQADLLDAQNNLSYCTISAPIQGRIGKVTYTTGNYVTINSEKLADIVQIAPIYATFAISENDFLTLFGSVENMKKSADITLRQADGKQFPEPGKVHLVDNKVDPETNTIMIWATFENSDLRLLPGGFVTVELSKKINHKVPAVKLSALLNDNQGSYIYVVGPDNVVERRPITVGPMVNNMQTVLSGVTPGEIVIVDGTHKVRPGSPITPVEAAKSEGK